MASTLFCFCLINRFLDAQAQKPVSTVAYTESVSYIVKRYVKMSASGATDSGYLPIVFYYKLSVI